MTHVFAYGSLLQPDSLSRTLPTADLTACVPARCTGMTRAFDVAFPNDGSQSDKAYFEPNGRRPPFVLFANLAASDGFANGVCIPVSAADLAILADRERRYSPVDVTELIDPYPGWNLPPGEVLAFLGRPQFRGSAGVVPAAYIRSVLDGGAHWDAVCPGFLKDLHSTIPMAPTAELTRVDTAA